MYKHILVATDGLELAAKALTQGLSRLLLGSQAHNVATHSTIPVLICR